MTEEILKLLLEIKRGIEAEWPARSNGWNSISARIDAILARGPKQNLPWYHTHQWGKDREYQWYQSCHCSRCLERTEEITAEQSRQRP